MILVIEGPDGSGKSTLAKSLANLYGYEIKHFSAPKTLEEETKMLSTYMKLLNSYYDLIIDRAWPSERVYGPIFRDHTFISETAQSTLENLFKDKLMYIYCTGDPEIMWQRAQQRGENFVTDYETFLTICATYNYEMLECPHHVPVFMYDCCAMPEFSF